MTDEKREDWPLNRDGSTPEEAAAAYRVKYGHDPRPVDHSVEVGLGAYPHLGTGHSVSQCALLGCPAPPKDFDEEAVEILRALAAKEPTSDETCVYCDRFVGLDTRRDHAPECPWLRAKRLVEGA